MVVEGRTLVMLAVVVEDGKVKVAVGVLPDDVTDPEKSAGQSQ